MNTEADLRLAETKLSQLDPQLAALIVARPPIALPVERDYFYALCRSIIGQQVSLASASAIFGRLEAATQLDPAAVIGLTDEAARTIGLSGQKTAYLRDLARHFVDHSDAYDHLSQSPDEAVISELTLIKGIGVWTAQMFLMFTLRRPDVFALDDIGLQRAMMRLYGWETLPNKLTLGKTADRWRPYRTVAALYLWDSLENTPA